MTAKPIPTVNEMNRLYFEGTARGELRIRHCPRCDARFRFAHEWCPVCWSLDIGWKTASGRGTISHFSIVYQPPLEAFETPYVLVLVDLEEGVRMMANLVGCQPTEASIGLPVTVTFEQRGDVWLPMFTPVRQRPG